MKRKRVLPLCLGALLACASANAQEKASITLEDLVQESLARNRDVMALRQRVVQAQGLARQAGVRPAPTLEAEAASGRPAGSVGENEFTAAFVQPVETFGKRKDRVRVAELAIKLARAELDQRSVQITYDIEVAYLAVVNDRQKIAVFDRLSETLRESQRLIEARVREGDAARLDAQLLTVESSRADAQHSSATGQLAAAEMDLRRVTGLALTDALPSVISPTTGKLSLSVEQLIARALDKRPDLRTARLLEQQSEAETTLAKAEARPDVTLSARYAHEDTGFEHVYGFTSAGVLTPIQEQYNTISVGVSVPLMSQRRSRGAIEAAAAGAASARLSREYLQSTIPLEVRSAYERWTAAVRTRDLLRDGVVDQSNKNLAVIRQAYQLGQLRLLDVLHEQRRLTETDLAYLDAGFQAERALADLERATGGLLP